jgi:hypothetical protein
MNAELSGMALCVMNQWSQPTESPVPAVLGPG